MGGEVTKRTICRFPHLAELVCQIDLNGLPNDIPYGKCEYRYPHEKAWVQHSFFDPHESREENEYSGYMLRNWVRQGDQFPVRIGMEVCWV